MIHPYLRRRDGLEPVEYPNPEVKAVLERTLGVPLFQEQVIKLAMVAAGFTAGEADQLRRSMASWRRNGAIHQFRDRLVNGMRSRGYSAEYAQRIFQQLEGFGEYGFPESHAASFALLAYASAWLKCHEPAAFVCALLNSQPMGFYAPSQLVQDARRHGVVVKPVDVTVSGWDCTLDRGEQHAGEPALRLGLRMVRGLREEAAGRLVDARRAAPFRDVADVAQRASLDRRDIQALSRAGALSAIAGHRHRASWAALGIEAPLPMLDGARIAEGAPLLRAPTEGEGVIADYASLGLTLGRHPLALLRPYFESARYRTAFELHEARNGEEITVVGLVTIRQRPGTATGVVFITLEDETGQINVVVWSSLVESQRRELFGAKLLGVVGTVQREHDVTHVIAKRLHDHSRLLGRLRAASRDFH